MVDEQNKRYPEIVQQFLVDGKPHYVEVANEYAVFNGAFQQNMPLVLKGPTGCGKTRFVESMAYHFQLPLVTVACHEDLSAADLVGRYLFKDNQTVWEDGPLTLAVRYGCICYLDEVVEARNDTTVIIHSLTDHRRILYVDKTQEVIHAHSNFMMIISYNPGYQNVTKELKESTKQRFAALTFDYPSVQLEARIVAEEASIDADVAQPLAEIGNKIRNLKGFGLNEGISTRLLVYTGQLIASGLKPSVACKAAITDVLTDDVEMAATIRDIVDLFFPAKQTEEDETGEGLA